MKNWAGSYDYRARRLLEPRSVEELRELVWRASAIRALGTRHAFNDIGDTDGDLVSLRSLPRRVEVDQAMRSVRIDGGITYGELSVELARAGWALHNLASLPHISVAGAVSTGTHGSGRLSGSLATAVLGMDFVRADGELISVRASDPELDRCVVALGALGIVVGVELKVEPAYDVAQRVYEDLPLDSFELNFELISGLAQSVSFFTEWTSSAIDQVWLKYRVTAGADAATEGASMRDLFEATPATRDLHPIRSLPANACTPQLGVAGPWHERLPHFRMGHTPSSGEEIQSEYFVAIEDAVDAFSALWELRERIAQVIQVTEIRTIAADDLWLSPCYGRQSAAFHFTWRRDAERVSGVLPDIEAALSQFGARPHWAKLFTMPGEAVRQLYPKLAEFSALRRSWDPSGKFENEFVRRYLG
jgi:alditol oxidase